MNTTNENGQSKKPLVMVVDDNPEFLSGIELTLQMEEFEVWKAANGQEALDELYAVFTGQGQGDSQPTRSPDLILADIMMPVMDGYEFYDKVRKNPYLNHIPFVFLTAKGDPADIRYGKELGSDDYLPKMTPTEDMLATIRGKLKRLEQSRSIASRFTWKPDKPLEGRSIIVVATAIVLIALAFGVGFALATIWF